MVMQYKAYIKQRAEGCDYTIGCAQTVLDIEADSMDEAKQVLSERIKENYSHRENVLETAELYEVCQTFSVDLTSLYRDMELERQKESLREKEEADRREFERLKNKFGQ